MKNQFYLFDCTLKTFENTKKTACVKSREAKVHNFPESTFPDTKYLRIECAWCRRHKADKNLGKCLLCLVPSVYQSDLPEFFQWAFLIAKKYRILPDRYWFKLNLFKNFPDYKSYRDSKALCGEASTDSFSICIVGVALYITQAKQTDSVLQVLCILKFRLGKK